MSRYPAGDAIQCFSGTYFRPLDPVAADVHIEDIARSLSFMCRFAGHVKHFYSVGEHSLRVSYALEASGTEIALWGLLHDASEAYLVDVPRPIKHEPRFAFYREAESRVMGAICERFGLTPEQPHAVDVMDKRMLVTEARDLLREIDLAQWTECYGEPLAGVVIPQQPAVVECDFLERFHTLMQRRSESVA